MKIDQIEVIRVRLPLVAPFRTSFGTQHERETLLVHVYTPDADGWGECVALADPLYSPEYVDGADAILHRHLVPRLLSAGGVRAHEVDALLAPVKGHRMAKAALELAVLDAELRGRGASLAAHLGATTATVESGVSVGIMESVPELLDAVGRYVAEGYRRIKLKIEPGWDIEPVRAVRELIGDDFPLQVDANTAYTLADARHLQRLDEFGLLLVEQPLPEDDLHGHAALARVISTPVCLDESIESARGAAAAIAMAACQIVNIKAGRVGGYLEARRIHDVCAAHGVPVWCGGMLETGIGRAANIALAALPNFRLPGDTSASNRFYRHDVTEPFTIEDGRIGVPDGPGIGVSPIPDALAELTVSSWRMGTGG